MDAGFLGRLHHLLVCRVCLSDANILFDGVGEKPNVLHDDADGGQKVIVGNVSHVYAADTHTSRVHIPEPQQEVGQRAFA